MRIVVDAMGGDYGIPVNVEGAVLASGDIKNKIILVGKKTEIVEELKKYSVAKNNIFVEDAKEEIGMEETPAQAVRQKKDSSIVVAAKMVAEGEADAFVSAGNSGAAMAAVLLAYGRIPGVLRPAIATPMPSLNGFSLLLDVGANVDCKPKNLAQFGVMGSIYMNEVINIVNPRVGLVSIGEEETKGNELTLAAFELLKTSGINFVGNIEGRDILKAKADVIVCDGFVGNIILKFAEGTAETMLQLVKKELKKYPIAWAALPFIWYALKDLRKKIDYSEYGGAPLLGVNGACIISHGSSNAKAIKNAIISAAKLAEKQVHKEIAEEMSKLSYEKEIN